jgi:hypothetical protein
MHSFDETGASEAAGSLRGLFLPQSFQKPKRRVMAVMARKTKRE